MYVTKCDVCKKQIRDKDTQLSAGYKFKSFHLCARCGGPVLAFLEEKDLLTENKKSPLQTLIETYGAQRTVAKKPVKP